MIIAIDGPAASGKGTLGKQLAAHYGLRHLDTGLLYRAVAKAVLDAGRPPDDTAAAVAAAKALDPAPLRRGGAEKPRGGGGGLGGLRHPGGARGAFGVSARFRRHSRPAPCSTAAISAPSSAPTRTVKIFVTATPEVRARRRALEYQAAGRAIDEATVLADIKKRDERDMGRAAAPLKQAPDAHLLDTTNMDISTAIRAAIDIVEATRAGRGRG